MNDVYSTLPQLPVQCVAQDGKDGRRRCNTVVDRHYEMTDCTIFIQKV